MAILNISNGESGLSVRASLNQTIDAVNPLTALLPTGVEMDYAIDAQVPGWVRKNGGSIGSALSGATERASDDTLSLYTLLWDNYSDATCPVSGGRGVSAAADFSANKTLTLPDCSGRVSVNVGSGITTNLGEPLGEENHTLLEAELPFHVHTYDSNGGNVFVGPGSTYNVATTGQANTGSIGSGVPFNQYQPSIITGCRLIKL